MSSLKILVKKNKNKQTNKTYWDLLLKCHNMKENDIILPKSKIWKQYLLNNERLTSNTKPLKKKKATLPFSNFWVGRERANKQLFFWPKHEFDGRKQTAIRNIVA